MGIAQGEQVKEIWKQDSAKRKQRCKKVLSKVSCDIIEVIRGDQVPTSISEALFKARALEKGWKPHRPSWPDFLVETESGLIAVEVKSRTDDVSKYQRETFNLLEEAGIPVYLWKNSGEMKSTLKRWKAIRNKLNGTIHE